MISIILLAFLGLLGVALIVVDFMQIFSPALLDRKEGQSTKVTIGLWLIGISVVSLLYKLVW